MDRGHTRLDEALLFVVWNDANSIREDVLDFCQFFLYSVDHRRGVCAVQLDDHSGDNFSNAVVRLETTPDSGSDLDIGKIIEVYGPAIDGLHDDALQILDRCGEAH